MLFNRPSDFKKSGTRTASRSHPGTRFLEITSLPVRLRTASVVVVFAAVVIDIVVAAVVVVVVVSYATTTLAARNLTSSEAISINRVPGWLLEAVRVPDFLKSLGRSNNINNNHDNHTSTSTASTTTSTSTAPRRYA